MNNFDRNIIFAMGLLGTLGVLTLFFANAAQGSTHLVESVSLKARTEAYCSGQEPSKTVNPAILDFYSDGSVVLTDPSFQIVFDRTASADTKLGGATGGQLLAELELSVRRRMIRIDALVYTSPLYLGEPGLCTIYMRGRGKRNE